MLVADITTQFLIEGKRLEPKSSASSSPDCYNATRTLRWASAGLLMHGPYFFLTFAALDRRMGATKSFRTVVNKTAVAQFIIFPPYLCALFAYMGFLEGQTDLKQHLLNRVPDAFVGGCVFWPCANVVNFAVVPSSLRVPYLAAVGSLWNTFLSWLNNAKQNKR
jgi:hypothetical protein